MINHTNDKSKVASRAKNKRPLGLNNRDKFNVEVFEPKSLKAKRIENFILILILALGVTLWCMDPWNIHIRAMIDNNPKSLWVFAPSTAVVGEDIEITVEAWDYCERLVCGYNAEIEFSSTDPNAILPQNYKFKPSGINQGVILAQDMWFGDKGMKKFIVRFQTAGIHYINVSEINGNLKGTSNPIVVYNSSNIPKYKLYWGDIHGHTSRCDGSGYLSEVLYYAKEIARCDFAAVTTHDHFIEPTLSAFGWQLYWKNTKDMINYWNREGDFVTLQAYEYRGEYFSQNSVGDMCIYSAGDDIPYYPGHFKKYTTPNLLFDALRKWKKETNINLIVIPHHTPHTLIGLRFDWSYYDDEFIRLVEIYSVHGNSELSSKRFPGQNRYPLIGLEGNRLVSKETTEPGHHVQDAIAMGFKVGFMASGDSHDGRIGHSISYTDANHLLQPPYSWGALPHLFRIHHHYQNGMIASYAENLTRNAIFNSIWNRRVYAVKGVSRPFVNFSINNVIVGMNDSFIYVPTNNTPRILHLDVAVGGGYGNQIERVIIYRNNLVWQNITCYNRTLSIDLVDTDNIEQLEYDINSLGIIKDGRLYIDKEADNYIPPSELNTHGQMVYYVKMYETQGGVAWAGPIWVGSN
ncbi:MAG: DUF3604 domain-containing protein [Promethearchaeota archaeon]